MQVYDDRRELNYEMRQYLPFHSKDEHKHTWGCNQAAPIHPREDHSLMIWHCGATVLI